MNKNKVTYTFCEKYDLAVIEKAVEKIFLAYPELDKKLKSKLNPKIVVKPNLLAPRHPDKAVTTHPVVLKAIIVYLKQYSSNIIIADSPAGTYNEKVLDKLYKTCEIVEVAEETGCQLNYDIKDSMVSFPKGKVLKKSLIINPALEADFIINVAKLKTHTLTRLTCATKNLFGLMPGVLKYKQHLAMQDLAVFSQMILDINGYFEDKVFNIVDGIIGMEGEGPSGGEPKFAGALFGGRDSCSVDIMACHIMGMPCNTVPILINYKGTEDIEINNFDEIRTYNFVLPPVRFKSLPDFIPEWLQNVLTEMVVAKPIINKNICKKCNICLESCPAEIISMKETGAYIENYKKCIKCYCCQEACPHKAINLSKPIGERLYKLFRK